MVLFINMKQYHILNQYYNVRCNLYEEEKEYQIKVKENYNY